MQSNHPDQSGHSNPPGRHTQPREPLPQRRPERQAPGREDHDDDHGPATPHRADRDKQSEGRQSEGRKPSNRR